MSTDGIGVLDARQYRNPMRLALLRPCAGKGIPCHTYLCWECQHPQVAEIRWRWELHTFSEAQNSAGFWAGSTSGLGKAASPWCPPFLDRLSVEQLCWEGPQTTKGSQGRVSRLWSFPWASHPPPPPPPPRLGPAASPCISSPAIPTLTWLT